MFKFPPNVAVGLTLTAYGLLMIFIVMRLFIKKRSRSALCRSGAMITLMLICTGDMIWVLCDDARTSSWLVPIFNVALILLFIRSIREIWI